MTIKYMKQDYSYSMSNFKAPRSKRILMKLRPNLGFEFPNVILFPKICRQIKFLENVLL